MPACDVLIVGAGPVGLALGLALSQTGRSVRLVDARAPEACATDARVLALSHGSRQTLERLGAWPATGWTPIETIHVSHQGGFGRCRIAAGDYALPALGYVMPAATLYRTLWGAATARGLSLCHPVRIGLLRPGAERIEAYDDGGEVIAKSRLVACCEGRIGSTEQIPRIERDYHQHALIARVTPATPHANRAYERFTPQGPLALLPLGADYSAVWTLPPARAQALLAADKHEFRTALQDAFGTRLRFTATANRAHFPLALSARQSPIGTRTVWLGNAAQTLHPVAGQGFNLALRDVWTLTEVLTDATDPGASETLAHYAQQRGLDRRATIGLTDGLVRLFSNDHPALTALRGAGLFALDIAPPLRHFLARRMLFGARAWV